jgi:hypothetical protein
LTALILGFGFGNTGLVKKTFIEGIKENRENVAILR